ncbi:ribonucleoside-diphosphate reductase alpha subunit protein [Rhizobium phage RHph_TM39]|uniref:Ribonucleoside-diphosphate reductase alpha subunit protein n=1 Tax=Rhizobium phage RHph_TM30 TaxID=2509764 RepID=A0A7S5UWD4_9CAUD|nr:ribonucleotide reductase [Rhizobium phage RHph_TM30]QIG71679.1 ribonucleoside-diphosphate reductase alpha subunit protein [Rhizobium phage RHph_TM40]QIG72042.1 ribonucleoside-diphosphate reductase alpha subunit protein [Rhizobium phage RHph_TM2_3B]QIG72405.1 ribonucleoside-diphosphate reductase alpha subunit protein [Rhizobium phage RHph_TM3_3_6]QIG77187.1 ribonucleoside-diphosphate reductase alpha subunit protein [Rhizobium phage RHph_TM39]QIG77507.1 ribonucleoside-diphosphate reductase al
MTNEYAEYRWLNEIGYEFLSRDYLLENETWDDKVNVIVGRAAEILGDKVPDFFEKFKGYYQKGYYSWSSPIISNFGTSRGLPISCFGSYIEDSMESILYTFAEVGMMSKIGGGTSGTFDQLRHKGAEIRGNGKSSGPVHFMRLFDTNINVVSQGKTRRGSFAAYMSVAHPDIMEHLTLRSEGSPIQDLSFGVTIPEGWMQSMLDGDKDKRKIWARILEVRANTGYPYIMFLDNVQNGRPDVYKDYDMRITHSNLCSEIMLPDSPDESFVCDLSSMNILYYDEWKDTDAVEYLTYFLDAVMTDFIEKARNIKFMERAVRFAERHRALGIGQFGWHSYLQSKMIPYESIEAKMHVIQIARRIKEKAYAGSANLATWFGEPELLKGYGRRNTTLIAIAPTKSSAFIHGQASEGIEPYQSNAYIKDLQKGKYTFKNPYLKKLLAEKGYDNDQVWSGILKNRGSVQNLEFLTPEEKSVFKTFSEISARDVIIMVAQRQKYVDQGQSTNIMIHPKTPIKDVHELYVEGWKLGIKSFYYQYSINAAQEFSRDLVICSSCEG